MKKASFSIDTSLQPTTIVVCMLSAEMAVGRLWHLQKAYLMLSLQWELLLQRELMLLQKTIANTIQRACACVRACVCPPLVSKESVFHSFNASQLNGWHQQHLALISQISWKFELNDGLSVKYGIMSNLGSRQLRHGHDCFLLLVTSKQLRIVQPVNSSEGAAFREEELWSSEQTTHYSQSVWIIETPFPH